MIARRIVPLLVVAIALSFAGMARAADSSVA